LLYTKILEEGGEENRNLKGAKSWKLPTVSHSMDLGVGQEICICKLKGADGDGSRNML